MNIYEVPQTQDDPIKNKELTDAAAEEFKNRMRQEILKFKEKIAAGAIKNHLMDLNEGNIDKLGDDDLRAFNEVILKGDPENEWYEKSEEFTKYLNNFREYREKKKQDGTYEPLKDLRRSFSGMISTHLLDKAIEKKELDKKAV